MPSLGNENSESPLVSIVLSYYNQTRYIDEAIQSALAQTYPNVEIIVVDDGSKEEAHQHLLKHPVRIIRKENGGVSSARNRGIQEANGDYIIFLDHDDRLLPDAAASHLEALKTKPDAGLIFSARRDIDETGRVASEPYLCSPRKNYFNSLLEANPIHCPASAMVSRKALEQVGGFDSSVEPGDDYDLYIRIARDFPVLRHTALVAEYRIHSTAVSRDGKKMYDSTVRVLDKVKRTMKLTGKELRLVDAGYGRAAAYFQGGTGPQQKIRLMYYKLRSLSQSSFLELLRGQ
jgi:glycosyltransferase involved in cell wall biosynthesis